MSTSESPQLFWQNQFQAYNLTPFLNDGSGLQYHRLDLASTWWHNPVNPKSLRLTKEAYHILTKSGIKTYKFTLTHNLLPKTFLQLEKHFESPYFILGNSKIVLFGEKEAVMLSLHLNDLQQYLDNQDS